MVSPFLFPIPLLFYIFSQIVPSLVSLIAIPLAKSSSLIASARAKSADFRGQFLNALNNDLTTSSGLTVLYDMLKSEAGDMTKRRAVAMFDEVFSLDLIAAAQKMKEEKSGAGMDGEMVKFIEEKIALHHLCPR